MKFGSTRSTSGEPCLRRRRSKGEEPETKNKGDGKSWAAMWPGTIVTQKLVSLHPLLMQTKGGGGGGGGRGGEGGVRVKDMDRLGIQNNTDQNDQNIKL